MIHVHVPDCSKKALDVVFIVDASGSVGPENILKTKEFIKSVIQIFDVSPMFTKVNIDIFTNIL